MSVSKPLAIVGIGCLFPKAKDLKEFWSNIKHRVDGITEVPATHWSPDDYFAADKSAADMTYARRGGFLSPVEFDAAEFGISPNTLEATDASQLLSLVAAQMALRDAGYGPAIRHALICSDAVTAVSSFLQRESQRLLGFDGPIDVEFG